MSKILKITSAICACNISFLTSIYGMIPNRNNQISDDSSTISETVEENDQNVQPIHVVRPVPQYQANRQPAQNVQPIQQIQPVQNLQLIQQIQPIQIHNGNIPANMVNFMFPLGMGHPVPAHVAPQPYQWVLPGAVTVDFTNPKHNEYLFEIRQNGTMIFRIMGQTLDSGHISFMTWVTQQGHFRRSGSWVRLPAGANAVIRFYRCTNCGAITWHDHNNKCPNCIHNTAPGANDRVFIFNRGLASQLCKNRALCAVGNCPIN